MTTTDPFRLSVDSETELTLLDRAHAPEFFALIDRNRVYLREWLAWLDRTQSVSDTEQFIDFTRREVDEKKSSALWIWHQGQIVGIVHLVEWNAANRKAAIGYWVGQESRGQGIAKKVVRKLCDYAFQELKLNRIEIRCGQRFNARFTTPTHSAPVALASIRRTICASPVEYVKRTYLMGAQQNIRAR